MEDDEAYFAFDHNGDRIEADRYNTLTYTYLGELACFNHVDVDLDPDDPHGEMLRIFRGTPNYNEMIAFIIKYKFMALINLVDVADDVVQSWHDFWCADLDREKGVPKGWSS